ncbi:hypothetical protein [Cohnella soli]|uniref:Uncharacterized protein n=1 Tax=Cohnella soli TaxID=425005 RepID=A0ABW0I3N5_9BACL
MSKLNYAQVFIRRTIIVLLGFMLIMHFSDQWKNDRRGINAPLSELKGDGPVTKIKVGRSFNVDEDTFTVDEVYLSSQTVLITYSYRSRSISKWSFPAMSLKLIMPAGRQWSPGGGGSSGMNDGQRGYITFDHTGALPSTAKLVYDLYDRHAELELPLTKAGESK